jgi:hypothetical protein
MAYPGGLQIGGGVTTDNAIEYLDAGASHVIVTSFVFREGRLEEDRLRTLVRYACNLLSMRQCTLLSASGHASCSNWVPAYLSEH